MLADPRAQSLVTGFALRWLNVDEIDAVDPDDRLFPGFTTRARRLRQGDRALRRERVARRSRRARAADRRLDLRQRTARAPLRHGRRARPAIPSRDGRRRSAPRPARQRARCCCARRTAIARRRYCAAPGCSTSSWAPRRRRRLRVSRRISTRPRGRSRRRCARGSSSIAKTRTARPATASSIRTAWRSRISRSPASGATSTSGRGADRRHDRAVSGEVLNGPIELRQALLRRPDQFVQALTTKLMMYALGRELEYYDMPQVRAVVRAAARDDYRFAAIVIGIVKSDCVPHARPCRTQNRTKSRPAFRTVHLGSDVYVSDEKASVAAYGAQRRRCIAGVAAAGRDDSRRNGAGANGCSAETARRLLLYSARRNPVEHGARPSDGSLEPERCRRELQVERDPVRLPPRAALRDRASRSSSSRPAGRRPTASSASSSAPTTTSSSRSAPAR